MSSANLRIRRFTPVMQLWHAVLIILFMLLTVSGLAWMYVETAWGRQLCSLFGGPSQAVEVHKIAGLVLLVGFVLHIFYALSKVDWSKFPGSLFGPDMLMMTFKDVSSIFRHIGWIFGLCKAPTFDRWTWWGKFDYWAVWWGFTITGVTGLILYDPILSSDYMPGWFLNVMTWIHRIEAFLAFTHVFTIHFLVEHFRVSHFPFNASMFDGTVSLEKAKSDHSEWIARLESEGRLDDMMVPEPPVFLRILYFGVGYAIIGFSVLLLVFAFMNIMHLSLY